jgi:hypothetical protein
MFFNSLQLIAHLPMIRTHMPAIANLFILNYLAIVRLQIGKLNELLEELIGADRDDRKDYLIIEQGHSLYYNELMHACGYHTSLIRNLI